MNTSSDSPSHEGLETVQFDAPHDTRLTSDQLAAEWVDRCIELLRPMDWTGRMNALMQLHDQLRNDFSDFNLFCEVFPLFVGRTVDRLGTPPVEDLNQAHIYANSAKPEHRKAAGNWLAEHDRSAD